MQIYNEAASRGYADINGFHQWLENVAGLKCSRSTAGAYSKQAQRESQEIFKRLHEARLIAAIVEEGGTAQDLSIANALVLESRIKQIIEAISFTPEEIEQLDTKEKLTTLKLATEAQNHLTGVIAKAKPGRVMDNAEKAKKAGQYTSDHQSLQATYMAEILKVPQEKLDALYPRADASAGTLEEPDATTES